jgi:glycosyltransferase involved in cell wall biosynthesis
VHHPEEVRIFEKELTSLAERYTEVRYICRVPKQDEIRGIKRIPIPEFSNEWLRIVLAPLIAFIKAMLLPRDSIYHLHVPELLPMGLVMKWLGRTVIYDVHEDTPRQILTKVWIPEQWKHRIAKVAAKLEQLAAVEFDQIITCEPVTQRRFERYGSVLLRNFPKWSEFESVNSDDYTQRDPVLVYYGQLTELRGITRLLEVLELINTKRSDPVRLILGGKWVPEAYHAELQSHLGWRYVDYRGFLSREQIREALQQAQLGVLLVDPHPKYLRSFPVKPYEYLAAGVPTLLSDFPAWHEMPVVGDFAYFVDPTDPQAIADRIQQLLNAGEQAVAQAQRAHDEIRSRYCWEQEVQRLFRIYDRLMREDF